MKNCKRCEVKVNENTYICPLCKTVLNDYDEKVIEDVYPIIGTNIHKYNILRRIFLYLFSIGSVIAIVINYATYNGILWSAIYIAAVLYLWSIITKALKRRSNLANNFFIQTILVSMLTIITDFAIGYKGWSFNYLIPGLFITANIAILIVVISNRTKWQEYVIYQIAAAALGFIPSILFFCKVIREEWITITSSTISFMILGGIFIFSNKNVRSEFKRRFHF